MLIVLLYSATGLLRWLGMDWGMFWSADRAFFTGPRASAYDLDAIGRAMQSLVPYYHGSWNIALGPAPFAPAVFIAFYPFTIVSPPLGFAVWTALNLAAITYVIYALARRIDAPTWLTLTTVLLFFPIVNALMVGQLILLLVLAFYLGYRALETGHEVRAGIWLGLLLILPQIGVFTLLVLLIKRRWSALVGAAAVGAGLAVSYPAFVGFHGIVTFVNLLLDKYTSFRQAQASVHPEAMISWRGLLVNLWPSLHGALGIVVTIGLSLAVVALLPWIWRGSWEPTSDRFGLQWLSTILIALLAGYHSHIHSASLLVVPAMVVVGRRAGSSLLQALLRVGPPVLYLALLAFFTTYSLSAVAVTFVALILLCLAIVLASLAHISARTTETRLQDTMTGRFAPGGAAISPESRPAARM